MNNCKISYSNMCLQLIMVSWEFAFSGPEAPDPPREGGSGGVPPPVFGGFLGGDPQKSAKNGLRGKICPCTKFWCIIFVRKVACGAVILPWSNHHPSKNPIFGGFFRHFLPPPQKTVIFQPENQQSHSGFRF